MHMHKDPTCSASGSSPIPRATLPSCTVTWIAWNGVVAFHACCSLYRQYNLHHIPFPSYLIHNTVQIVKKTQPLDEGNSYPVPSAVVLVIIISVAIGPCTFIMVTAITLAIGRNSATVTIILVAICRSSVTVTSAVAHARSHVHSFLTRNITDEGCPCMQCGTVSTNKLLRSSNTPASTAPRPPLQGHL